MFPTSRKSPRNTTGLQATEISSPGVKDCFARWTLWLYILLWSLYFQNPTLNICEIMSNRPNSAFVKFTDDQLAPLNLKEPEVIKERSWTHKLMNSLRWSRKCCKVYYKLNLILNWTKQWQWLEHRLTNTKGGKSKWTFLVIKIIKIFG